MSDSTCTQNMIFLCASKERVTKTLVLSARRPASARGARAMLKKGLGGSSLIRIRQFYLAYPKDATLSHLLGWSHIVELLKIDDPLEGGFATDCARIPASWTRAEFARGGGMRSGRECNTLERQWGWERSNHPGFNPVEFDGIKYRRAPQEFGGGMAVSLVSDGSARHNLSRGDFLRSQKNRSNATLGGLSAAAGARLWK